MEPGATTHPETRQDAKPQEMCDVCGMGVPAEEAVKAEMTTAGAMCPTAMTFHPACYERASVMWDTDEDSYCTTDPLFPETGQWTQPAPTPPTTQP